MADLGRPGAGAPLAITSLSDVDQWARGRGLEIVLIVLGSILLARLLHWVSGRLTDRIDSVRPADDTLVRSEASKYRHAVAQVTTWTVVVAIYCVAAILVLQRLGVPLTGFVPPATVLGVALGFGAQRVVQDVLAGFFLIAERQYGFGDLIRISVPGLATPVLGTVEELSLRVTRVRSVAGDVVVTPNGQIVQITNLSRDWARAVLDVPVPASADVNAVSDILRRVGAEAYDDEDLRPLLLDPPSVMGVESMEVDQFKVRVVARTLPGRQFEVGRALRARITRAFLAANIHVPTALDTSEPTGVA